MPRYLRAILSCIRPCLPMLITATAMLWLCGEVLGQESPTTDAKIVQLVEELGANSFLIRQTATQQLRKLGDAAIGPLKNAEADSSPEQKQRIQSLLRELSRNSFESRLKVLAESLSAKSAEGLPEWKRYSKLVGRSSANIKLYVRLLQSETQLFAMAAQSQAKLGEQLELRSAELLQATRPAALKKGNRFSLDSYCAILLLAGNESYRLVRGTSTNISALLNSQHFNAALTDSDGPAAIRLAGSYIQRRRISVIAPLQFARRHPSPEGLTLARSVLKTALRGDNGLYAMMLLKEQGREEDIELLESLFDHQGVLFRGVKKQTPGYSVLNGDLALAVAITMRNKDPRDFGFATNDNRSRAFRFVLETTGFRTNEHREAARRKYATLWPSDVKRR